MEKKNIAKNLILLKTTAIVVVAMVVVFFKLTKRTCADEKKAQNVKKTKMD